MIKREGAASMTTFRLEDWAGNVLENGMEFKSFDDAWDHVSGEMADRLGLNEEDFEDYFAIEIERE